MLRHVPEANLILYSDDIAACCKTVDELQRIFTRLCEALAYFNMGFDYTKSQFIRLGDFNDEEITLKDPAGNEFTIKYSDKVR